MLKEIIIFILVAFAMLALAEMLTSLTDFIRWDFMAGVATVGVVNHLVD